MMQPNDRMVKRVVGYCERRYVAGRAYNPNNIIIGICNIYRPVIHQLNAERIIKSRILPGAVY